MNSKIFNSNGKSIFTSASRKTSGSCRTCGTLSFLTERHLQAVWLEQKYFKCLRTTEGDSIEILSPGIWNQEAGPDFFKAHLLICGKEIRGDVEIHLSSEDWYNHRHHQDIRYNNVVLHVSLWEPKKAPKAITREDGIQVQQAFLENYLTIPQSRICQLIDLDLYPYKKFVGSGRCAQQLFHKMPDRQIVEFFKNAAIWRLSQKDQHLRSRVEDPALYSGAGMAMALGYKNNTETFLRLFLKLHPLRHLGEESILAIAFGSCGLFENAFQEKWGFSSYYKRLQFMYMMLAMTHSIQEQFKLLLNQVRPFNHPVRRLALLAKLIVDDSIAQLGANMIQCWEAGWKTAQKGQNWTKLRNQFCDQLPAYEDPYWNHHYFFEEEASQDKLTLMGAQLKQEMIVNTFLPMLYHAIRQNADPMEIEAFREFFATFLPPSIARPNIQSIGFLETLLKGIY